MNFLFPSTCLHCQVLLPQNLHVLCNKCLEALVFSDPALHCRRCFALLDHPDYPLCNDCIVYPSPFRKIYALFEQAPPLHTLKHHLNSMHGETLIKAIAGFMAYYYLQQRHVLPDYIISLGELGSELGAILQIPHVKVKKSLFEDFSIKQPQLLEDATLLLVAITQDSTFKRLAERLLEYHPTKILGLCLIH